MRFITLDDIIDTYAKLNQRGLNFITSKFNFSEINRAKTAFNHETFESSNWWIIPTITNRWNKMVTGNENLDFINFAVNTYLKNKQNIKMLSLGSGNCASELKFATYPNFEKITCNDISEILLKKASEVAENKQLNNIEFIVQDVNSLSYIENSYDIVYFRASLHHFKNINTLVGKSLKKILKPNGILIIDEYIGPNRLQFSKNQINTINNALKLIPKKHRKRFKINLYKNKIYGSGIIRMKIADPSECIESEKILPSIHKNYKTIFETGYGGNILMSTLKDISHHFVDLNIEKEKILNNLFEFEDSYLQNNQSDFVFGIYENIK